MYLARLGGAMAALPLLFAPSARAQVNFEGVAVFKTTMEGKSFETTYYSKGRRSRQDISFGAVQSTSITDYAAGKGYTLIPAQKKYLVMDYKELGETAKKMGKAMGVKREPVAPPKITATGHKETIAGYPCEHYLLQAKAGDPIDFCVAKGLGTYQLGGGGGGQGGRAAAAGFLSEHPEFRELATLFKDGFFPLKMTISKGGKTVMVQEAIRVERKSVPDVLFAIPEGYSQLKMPSLPGLTGKRP